MNKYLVIHKFEAFLSDITRIIAAQEVNITEFCFGTDTNQL